MPETARSPAFLLTMAAESAAPAMPGCAEAFNFAGKAPTLDKAHEIFGPRIVAQWLVWLGSQTPEEQRAAIESLARLLAPEARREATSAIRRLIPFANPSDEAILIDYLTMLPGRVKLSLLPDAQTGQRILPPDWSLKSEQTLLDLLAPGSRSRASFVSAPANPAAASVTGSNRFDPAGPLAGPTSPSSPSSSGSPGSSSGSKSRIPIPKLPAREMKKENVAPARESALQTALPAADPEVAFYDPPPTPIPGSLAAFGFFLNPENAEKNRRARQRMMQNRLERGRPSREAAAQKKMSELNRLKNSLTLQIEDEDWKAAHRTV